MAAIFTTASSSARTLGAHQLTARYLAFALRGVSQSKLANASTVPIWSSSVSSLGSNYNYQMVGKNPFVAQANASTTVPVDIVPVKIVIGGTTFDPSSTSGCTAPNSVDSLTAGSPLLKNHGYAPGGTNVGTVQYLDFFQRANFWSQIGAPGAVNPGYHVILQPTMRPVVTVNVPAADGSILGNAGCGLVGQMNVAWWQGYIQGTLIPSLSYTNVRRFPLLLLNNVVEYSGGQCCVIGFHGAYSTGAGVQTYAQSDYDSTAAFANLSDVGALSHEVGEWMDDPFGSNPTPLWGHTGQVSGCQGNLEVGDPLSGPSGHNPVVKMGNGITYHPQELAFWSWFYRHSANGVNGWFSSNGTFRHSAGAVCH